MGIKDTYQQWVEEGEAEEMLAIMQSLAMQGYTVDAIAKELGICERTLLRLQKEYPSVKSALKNGRRSVVALLQRSLVQRANEGDTTAIIYGLKIYGGEYFRKDKVQVQAEVTGANGGPVGVAVGPQIYLPQKDEGEDGE